MSAEASHAGRRPRPLPGYAARETLEELPSRRPPPAPSNSFALHWDRVGVDRYEIRRGARTLGFIDVVGAVFVVLAGERYSHAVEAVQTLVFEDALGALGGVDAALGDNDNGSDARPERHTEVTP
jgi:hypothetical protein